MIYSYFFLKFNSKEEKKKLLEEIILQNIKENPFFFVIEIRTNS
jgi:hypothetical protein